MWNIIWSCPSRQAAKSGVESLARGGRAHCVHLFDVLATHIPAGEIRIKENILQWKIPYPIKTDVVKIPRAMLSVSAWYKTESLSTLLCHYPLGKEGNADKRVKKGILTICYNDETARQTELSLSHEKNNAAAINHTLLPTD